MTRLLKLRHNRIINNTDYQLSDTDPIARGRIEDLRGARFYLTSIHRPGQACTYRLALTPACTNMSHEPRVTGWLGTTDNVDRHAFGIVEIVGQSSTHLHLCEISGADLGPQPAAFQQLLHRLNAEIREANAALEADLDELDASA